jgi:LPXTG-motif cell wall-anchored protein
MKRTKVLYWILTGLMAAFMLMASIPDVLQFPEVVAFFTHLGYPPYLLPFIGTAKILAVLAILFPAFPRLKEWAYAGLVFDLIGALYSHFSVGDSFRDWIFAFIGLLLVGGSYVLFRKKQSYESFGQFPRHAVKDMAHS